MMQVLLIKAGLDPFDSFVEDVLQEEISQSVETLQVSDKKAIKHLSFDNYHEQWLNLATSADPNSQFSSFRKDQKELLQNHKHLLYGKFKSNRSGADLNQKKKNRLEHLKTLYHQPDPVEAVSWETEAQELLEWTKSLATD